MASPNNNLPTEVWETAPHSFDDDGYPAKCYGGAVAASPNCFGEMKCAECGQVVKLILVAEY